MQSMDIGMKIDTIKFGVLNTFSARNRIAVLGQCIENEVLDVFVITETWHENSDDIMLKRITPEGFICIDAARPLAADANIQSTTVVNHGGIAIVSRRFLNIKRKTLNVAVTSFEYLCGYTAVGNNHFVVLGVYRPGSESVTNAFFTELTTVLEKVSTYRCAVIVCGDFNVHVDDAHDSDAIKLQRLLESFDCRQHVDAPTHKDGHTLDLVITQNDTVITELKVGDIIADHSLISFRVRAARPAAEYVERMGRCWSQMDMDQFHDDLATTPLCDDVGLLNGLSAEEMASLYSVNTA